MAAFVVSHEAWYWPHLSAVREAGGAGGPEVGVMSHSSGGVDWEFTIRWIDVGQDGPCPRVEMFDDSWAAWLEIPEFFGRLARLGDRSVGGVIGLLLACGFDDATDRVSPATSSPR